MSPNRKVLLVDDDPDLLVGVEARLHAAGYETLSANNGEEGLAAAVEHQPDTILLDVRMEGMDGLTMLNELRTRRDTAQIPVVMLSACVRAQSKALDAGARFFLSKPYDGPSLVRAIDTAVQEKTTNSGI